MSYCNRTLCDVLEEMRDCKKSLNFSYLLGLIEEVQSMGNRMEAKLEDIRDFKSLKDQVSKLEKERDNLHDEIERLEKKNMKTIVKNRIESIINYFWKLRNEPEQAKRDSNIVREKTRIKAQVFMQEIKQSNLDKLSKSRQLINNKFCPLIRELCNGQERDCQFYSHGKIVDCWVCNAKCKMISKEKYENNS